VIPLIDIPEQSFDKLQDLRDVIASQDKKIYEAPIKEVSLSEDGVLRAGRFEGRLAKPAFCGLLHTEGVPQDFAFNRCPVDLLVTIVRRLACEQNTSIVIQTINGVATGIMPADRQPIQHDMLIDRLGVDRPIKEATLSADCLRITAAPHGYKELLPNDTYGFGWELITSENGWRSTEVWRWIVREICTNGAVGFDKAPIFKRTCNSHQPVLISLQGLLYVLENAMQPPELETAVKWAADRRIGAEHELVVDYLSRKLQADATRTELNGIGVSTTWYDLMNTVTSLARLHTVEVRRRYEAEGGALLNWFSRQGRSRPPWRKLSCEECEVWNANAGEQDISRGRAEQGVNEIKE
jgi:hypothetical protein